MEFQTVLITGGAGFIGSNLAFSLKEARPELKVLAMDNLKRRGSELNLPRLRAAGVEFSHGDVRSADDFTELPRFDVLIDCSAEPSVHAGQGGSPRCPGYEPVWNAQLPRGGAGSRRCLFIPEHEPDLSDRRLERLAVHGNGDSVSVGRHNRHSGFLEPRDR